MRSPAELAVTIPRRWVWALGVAIAVLVGLLGWLLLVGRVVAPGADETAQGIVGAGDRRVMGPVPLRLTTAPQHLAVAGDAARGVDEYEICGGAWVKANPDGSVDEQTLRDTMRRDEAALAVDRALAIDSRPLAQAARLLLGMIVGGDDRRRASMAGALGCGGEACAPTLAASGPDQDAEAAVAASREALARLAVTTTDPAAYAIAYRVCGPVREGSCGMLSADQWARLDPGNAAPWYEVYAAAQKRKDSASANEALHRIATSQRSDQRVFEMAGMLIDAVPQDDALRNGAFMLAVEMIGVEVGWVAPAMQPLVAACRREPMRDSNRRQTCEAIADLLFQKSDTLIERSTGAVVGRQLGWSEERLDRMRAEHQAFAESSYAGIEPSRTMGCESIKRVADDLRRKARLGEVGAMREWLAREAPPSDELLRRYRAAQAAQAASAASATGQ